MQAASEPPAAGAQPLHPGPQPGPGPVAGTAGAGSPRLRVLCLHGFRQSAHQFQGRLSALRKRVADLAELVFVDAPHELPLYVKQAPPPQQQQQQQQEQPPGGEPGQQGAGAGAGAQSEQRPAGQGARAGPKGRRGRRARGGAAAGQQGAAGFPQGGSSGAPSGGPPAPRRAWLVVPQGTSTGSEGSHGQPPPPQQPPPQQQWQQAPGYVDAQQHTRQSEGWPACEAALTAFLARHGRLDGVLGFSQGAAVAAALCALQQRDAQQREQQGQQREQREQQREQQPVRGLRFAILASGYVARCPELEALHAEVGPLQLPSLHIFGSGSGGEPGSHGEPSFGKAGDRQQQQQQQQSGQPEDGPGAPRCPGSPPPAGSRCQADRQVSPSESLALVRLFSEGPGAATGMHGAEGVEEPQGCPQPPQHAAQAGRLQLQAQPRLQQQGHRVVVQHAAGHLLPGGRGPVLDAVRAFLLAAQQRAAGVAGD